ncbi:helix-turn-helix domain-containing protein [Thermoflexus hugenholtzii]|uniref:Helix-turn-helix protein n=1 Tax=Tepidiforma thermophila (strain KCTC 52669 / CGMCC 1.13589 / G233) TaxID=2761530 RepID=A0A2A9HFC3_TEPT2|nr:helix-turn-helix protein [Tepidiforma thermophila]
MGAGRASHPSSLIPHPSSLIPHPSSLIPHPSSLIPHPSVRGLHGIVYTARVEERERYEAGGSTERAAGWTPERVSALRRRLGLTQAEFARRLGVRQQTVSEWETGLHRPRGASTTLLRMLAEEAGRWEEGAPAQPPGPAEGGGSREPGAGSWRGGRGEPQPRVPTPPREEGSGRRDLGGGSGERGASVMTAPLGQASSSRLQARERAMRAGEGDDGQG